MDSLLLTPARFWTIVCTLVVWVGLLLWAICEFTWTHRLLALKAIKILMIPAGVLLAVAVLFAAGFLLWQKVRDFE